MNNYENFEELFGKKKKKGGIKDKLKKVIEKVKDKGKDAVLTPLLPLKPAMKKALDKKKIKHDNTISDIAQKFAQHIVNKKEGFETTGENFAIALAALVPLILGFFKKLKENKDAGNAPLEDINLLDTAEQALAAFNPDTAIEQEEKAEYKSAAAPAGGGRSSEDDGGGESGGGGNTMTLVILALIAFAIFKRG